MVGLDVQSAVDLVLDGLGRPCALTGPHLEDAEDSGIVTVEDAGASVGASIAVALLVGGVVPSGSIGGCHGCLVKITWSASREQQ